MPEQPFRLYYDLAWFGCYGSIPRSMLPGASILLNSLISMPRSPLGPY